MPLRHDTCLFQRENVGSIFLCELVSLCVGVASLEGIRGKRNKEKIEEKAREERRQVAKYCIKLRKTKEGRHI
jgi:hypothetical protein